MTNIQQPQVVCNKIPPPTIPPRAPSLTPFPLHTPPCPPPQNAPPSRPPQNSPPSPSPPPIQPTSIIVTPIPPSLNSPPYPLPPPRKSTLTLEKETAQIPITHNDTSKLMDILSNPDLFNAHILKIDQALKRSPTRNSRNTSLDVTHNDNVTYSHSLPSFTPHNTFRAHIHTSHKHSLNHPNMSDPIITTETSLSSTSAPKNDLKPKTWKRLVPLTPPTTILPSQTHDLPTKDLKRKNHFETTTLDNNSLDKKLRLDVETKALSKLFAENLGLVVAATQHYRAQ